MADLATSAIRAVRDYEHWHQEVARLTTSIGACTCPKEEPPPEDSPDFLTWDAGEHLSCFSKAKAETSDADNWRSGYHDRPLNLDEIADEVADCPSCSRLCVLIAERKAAKVQRGIAKRRVRQVGKLAMREAPHG